MNQLREDLMIVKTLWDEGMISNKEYEDKRKQILERL